MPSTEDIMDSVDNSAPHWLEDAVTATDQDQLPPYTIDTADSASIIDGLVALGLFVDDT